MPGRISLIKKVVIMGMMLLLPTSGSAVDSSTLLQFLGTEHTPVLPLLPAALPVADSFKPSTTSYAGTVSQVQGTAYVYHQDGTTAYKLKNDLPLFNGDTLVTEEKSGVTVQMTDETALNLAGHTKLTIDKSLPRIKVRDTVVQLFFGRVRALVKKIAGEYILRTPTAIICVRGTDFAAAVAPAPDNRLPGRKEKKIMSSGLLTAVLTGGDQSSVEFAGFFGPSITVKPLSVAAIRTGEQAGQAVYVGPAAVSLLRKIGPPPEAGLIPPKNVLPENFLSKNSQLKNVLPENFLPKNSQLKNVLPENFLPKNSQLKNVLPKNFLPKNFPEKPLQKLPRKPVATAGTCRDLFINIPGAKEKQSFKVCGPGTKTPGKPPVTPPVTLPVNLWPGRQ
ncbi:MAG: hypothetical protein D3914_14420 [Candidatus Electrothrix sp. LOE2]|nr:hypothetical protein [Candidatus Electrothrix sp. LOE2]